MLDGGKTEDGSPMAYLYGTGVKLPESAKKDGYSFAGWYQDEKFSGQRIEKITENESGDKVIYAKWIPNVTDKDKSDSDLSRNKPLDTKIHLKAVCRIKVKILMTVLEQIKR